MKPNASFLRVLFAGTAICLALLASLVANGRTQSVKNKRPSIDATKGLKIVYGSAPWNLDSTKIDTAFLFFRDAQSGKVVKILLEETEPDSSTFSGSFAVRWANIEDLSPEVYIPPKGVRGTEASVSKFLATLRSGKVKRRPIVFKKDSSGLQVLDVYDTKDQAKRALEAYTQQRSIEQQTKTLAKPVASKSETEAAKMAEHQAMLARLAEQAAKREVDRVRLEQLERQRTIERKKKLEALAKQAKLRQLQKAKEYAEQAMKHYRQGQFTQAEDLFRQSVDLDPTNTSYYYSYGVSLYRNAKYDEAIVALTIAKDTLKTKLEKRYYIALAHFRLKELKPALAIFSQLKSKGHPVISPSSAFYEGIILYGQEKYKLAKKQFEDVIDTSKDPRLDNKAEEYLEKIARIMAYNKNKAKKILLDGTMGATYDSNILYAPDNESSQGSTSTSGSDGGFRLLASGNAEYRFFYEKKHELSTKLSSTYIYSINSDFTRADPMLVTLTLPYTHKGTWSKKGYKLTVNPGYEVLYMDAEETGTRKNILQSPFVDTDVTVIMRDDWFANYAVNIKSDNSLLSDSSGDDDADALKFSLETEQSFFLDKSKKRAVIANGGLTMNSATGKNKKYHRIDLGVTYAAPFQKWKDSTWTGNLAVYSLNYPSADESRSDVNVALNLSLSKPVKEWFAWGLTAGYANNTSTSSANQYSKYTVMTTATFDWAK